MTHSPFLPADSSFRSAPFARLASGTRTQAFRLQSRAPSTAVEVAGGEAQIAFPDLYFVRGLSCALFTKPGLPRRQKPNARLCRALHVCAAEISAELGRGYSGSRRQRNWRRAPAAPFGPRLMNYQASVSRARNQSLLLSHFVWSGIDGSLRRSHPSNSSRGGVEGHAPKAAERRECTQPPHTHERHGSKMFVSTDTCSAPERSCGRVEQRFKSLALTLQTAQGMAELTTPAGIKPGPREANHQSRRRAYQALIRSGESGAQVTAFCRAAGAVWLHRLALQISLPCATGGNATMEAA